MYIYYQPGTSTYSIGSFVLVVLVCIFERYQFHLSEGVSMSSITDAISASIAASILNESEQLSEGQLVSQWMDRQKSAAERHKESACEDCAKSPSGKCWLADLLVLQFQKTYLGQRIPLNSVTSKS